MTENTPSPLGNVISIDDERIKSHLDQAPTPRKHPAPGRLTKSTMPGTVPFNAAPVS